ncbi:MAG: DUF1501 domain-containing protein, partial [Verrucomicrobiales bacterium]|nr:DUF1501 domain-containing protein [Verrucomicrobiales bacterium]
MNAHGHQLNRRTFLKATAQGLGCTALGTLLNHQSAASPPTPPGLPPLAAKAKRIIYLFQSGGPSQADLFDPKPQLERFSGQELPASVRGDQRITTMTAQQPTLPVTPTRYRFIPSGKSG